MEGQQELENRLCLMAKNAEEMLQLSFEALRHEKVELGEMAEKMASVIATDERELTGRLTAKAQGSADARPALGVLVDVVSHLGRIGVRTDAALHSVETKMRGRIPFSVQASHDLTFLFESALYLLRCTRDTLLTRNAILAKYIQETGGTLRESAEKFRLDHEGRLLDGRCRPEASAVFLDLLDSLNGIICHTRAIADRILRAPRD